MTATERLPVLVALQKLVKEELDATRAEADGDLLAAYEEDGVTKKALKVGGARVGDYIVALTSGKWDVTDRAALEEFALSYGFAHVERSVRPEYLWRACELLAEALPEAVEERVVMDDKWERYVVDAGGSPEFLDSGLAVPGLTWTGQRVRGTQVRGCKPNDVFPIVRRMGGVDAFLLGDGSGAEDKGDEA